MYHLIFILSFFLSLFGLSKEISPYEYGLASAKNGYEVYNVLLKTHEAAVEQGCNVTYKGIKRLEIDIPPDAVSIPLPQKVDFHNVKFVVRNNSKFIYLFSLSHDTKEIHFDKARLDDLNFSDVKEINKGSFLLIIEDGMPWVEKRYGYDYGATRKDIILVHDGRGLNHCVSTYNNNQSQPKTKFCEASTGRKLYSNLIFERTNDSKQKTGLFLCCNQYNIVLKNIKTKTPQSDLYGDAIITINNCAKVLLKDISIDGTYSAKNKYGYGISMNNVWNSEFFRLYGNAEWGVFGNYNVNYAILKDCDINRFDIHCYGRDIYCYNTVFRDWYNQFSSFYGDLRFENCKFYSFVPVLFEPSFYAYTPFKLCLKDCVIDVKRDRLYLINAGYPGSKHLEPREELDGVSWPNIEIDGLRVILPEGQDDWSIFGVEGDNLPIIDNISSIKIKGLQIKGYRNLDYIKLANKPIKTKEKLNIKVSSSSIKAITY